MGNCYKIDKNGNLIHEASYDDGRTCITGHTPKSIVFAPGNEEIKTALENKTLTIDDPRITYMTTSTKEGVMTISFSESKGGSQSLIMQMYHKYVAPLSL